MALRKEWANDEQGVRFPDAYHRIGEINLNYDARQCLFSVMVYVSQEARNQGKEPFTIRNFGFRDIPAAEMPNNIADTTFTLLMSEAQQLLGGSSPQKACYQYLKQHPLMTDSVDV